MNANRHEELGNDAKNKRIEDKQEANKEKEQKVDEI